MGVVLGRWNSKNNQEHFVLREGKLSCKRGGITKSNGVAKTFFTGGFIAVFENQGRWNICVNGKTEFLQSGDLILSLNTSGLFSSLLVESPHIKRTVFRQFTLQKLFEMLDPTYDSFDRESDDFFYFLIAKRKDLAGK